MGAEEAMFSENEMEAIDELKKRMTCDLNEKQFEDTFLFYRFLKARDFDVSSAEDMLRKHIQWRQQNSIDTITTDYKQPEVFVKYLANLIPCQTKTGINLHYIATGKYDIRGLILSAKYADIEKTFIKLIETDLKYQKENCSKKNGAWPGIYLIHDMEGFTFAQSSDKTTLEYIIRFAKIFQDNFPECLGKIFIINASIYFTFLFNVIKPFLAPALLKKFHVFSKEGWQEELLKEVDASVLPAFLGGEKTDPDGNPLCLTFVNHGGPIPASYHAHKSKRSLANQPNSKKLVLARAAFSEIAVQVQEADSLLEWEFETKSRDIGFGIFRKEGEGDKETITEIVPLARLETDNFSEAGMYKCEKAGTYVMLFDNSYSWIRSKEIYYTMKIVPPSEIEIN